MLFIIFFLKQIMLFIIESRNLDKLVPFDSELRVCIVQGMYLYCTGGKTIVAVVGDDHELRMTSAIVPVSCLLSRDGFISNHLRCMPAEQFKSPFSANHCKLISGNKKKKSGNSWETH